MQAVNALTDRLGEPQLDAFRPRMCERPRGNSYQFGAYVPHRYSMDDMASTIRYSGLTFWPFKCGFPCGGFLRSWPQIFASIGKNMVCRARLILDTFTCGRNS